VIELVLTICALTFASPYYDCNENWDINIHDDELLKCGREEASSLGCATYYLFSKGDKRIDIVSDYPERDGKHTPKLKHEDILWHELIHLICECDWHEYWDKKEDTRSHRYNQYPHVPETVIPYLKDEWIR